ncbi:MAG: hypothetical protein LH631_05530 [Alkalinema sp. CAN_BIN05]|nr:hypothetical protein [Alkalinema sp. CAN_BIN05]
MEKPTWKPNWEAAVADGAMECVMMGGWGWITELTLPEFTIVDKSVTNPTL